MSVAGEAFRKTRETSATVLCGPDRPRQSNWPSWYEFDAARILRLCGGACHRCQVRCVFRRDSRSLTLELPPSEISKWRAVSRVLRSPLDAVSCAVFPASCSLCGSPLPRLSSVPICSTCWSEVLVQAGSFCARCGETLDRPQSVSGTPSLCRACRLAAPPVVKAVAYGPYEGRMRDLIHALKYGRLRPAARELGRVLATVMAQLRPEAPAEMLVVPIPLHRAKQSDRGFNHARLIAAEALLALRKTAPDWRLTLAPSTLIRLRATESQAGLTTRQRRLNLRGAFAGVRFIVNRRPARPPGRRHSYHRRDRACSFACLAPGRRRVRPGGNAGSCALYRSRFRSLVRRVGRDRSSKRVYRSSS